MQSAEIRALQLQAYNVATARLDAAVAAAADPATLAVVTDLDETVIDNSALLARDLANCHVYDAWDTWLPWERDGDPTLIPGRRSSSTMPTASASPSSTSPTAPTSRSSTRWRR